jgi:hypothetical protein
MRRGSVFSSYNGKGGKIYKRVNLKIFFRVYLIDRALFLFNYLT